MCCYLDHQWKLFTTSSKFTEVNGARYRSILVSQRRGWADYVRYTIKAQRTYFPDLKIYWNHIIDQSLESGAILMKAISFASSSEMSCERKTEVDRRYHDYAHSIIKGNVDSKQHRDIERFVVDNFSDRRIDTTNYHTSKTKY